MTAIIKTLLSLVLCLCAVSSSSIGGVQLEEHYVKKAAMTISYPDFAYVTGRTVESDFEPLEVFGMSADDLELQYKKGSIYSNAIWFPEDTRMTEILVTVTEDEDSRTIFQLGKLDPLYVQALADSYASFAQQGQEVSAIYSSASVVRHDSTAFIKAHGAMASDSAGENHLHYMTIVNGRRIGITLVEHLAADGPYSGSLRVSAENEQLMDSIIADLRFDTIENAFVAKNRGFLVTSGIIIALCTALLVSYYISDYRAGKHPQPADAPQPPAEENASEGAEAASAE